MVANLDYTVLEDVDLLKTLLADERKWAAALNQTAVKLGYSNMDEEWLATWFAGAMVNATDIMKGTSPVLNAEDIARAKGDARQRMHERGLLPWQGAK